MKPEPIGTIDESADTIIQDLHRIREMLSDRFEGDLAAILEDARRRQAASGRKIIARGEIQKSRTRAERTQ